MDIDIKLIELVEKFPHLYMKTDPRYRNKLADVKAWTLISQELDVPMEECEKRWKVLRNRYSKERAKIRRSDGEMKEWPLYKFLTFLNPVVRSRKRFGYRSTSNVSTSIADITISDRDIQEILVTENSDDLIVVNPERSPYSKRKLGTEGLNVHDQHSESRVLFNSTSVDKCIELPDEALKNFCDSLYSDLKQVPRENLLRCKIEIMELIEKYHSYKRSLNVSDTNSR